MVSRRVENFREDLRKSMTFTDLRILDPGTLARTVDSEVVNKCRLSVYGKQSDQIKKMTQRSEDYEQMERARATKGDYEVDAREFALEDNVAVIYFNHYGHGFYGERTVNNPDHGWTCPACGQKYLMSLKLLPFRCDRCRHITPLGELVRDKVMRR